MLHDGYNYKSECFFRVSSQPLPHRLGLLSTNFHADFPYPQVYIVTYEYMKEFLRMGSSIQAAGCILNEGGRGETFESEKVPRL